MRYLKLLLSLTLFFSFYYQSNAQNPNQGVNGNIDNVAINSQYLNGSKIQLSSAATTSVKYNIDMSRSSNGPSWHLVNMKVGLGYLDGNSYKFFNGGHTFVGADFSAGQATLSKELTSVIDHTKLPSGSMIYVLYENHRPNVPQSGWFVEALVFNNNQVRYGFVLGTTGGSDPETPPSHFLENKIPEDWRSRAILITTPKPSDAINTSILPILTSNGVNTINSQNNSYKLVMQSDGNLVLYTSTNQSLWNSKTNSTATGFTYRLYYQTDGNLVIKKVNGLGVESDIWASYTEARAGTLRSEYANRAYIKVQNDGNVALYYNGVNGGQYSLEYSTLTQGGQVSSRQGALK